MDRGRGIAAQKDENILITECPEKLLRKLLQTLPEGPERDAPAQRRERRKKIKSLLESKDGYRSPAFGTILSAARLVNANPPAFQAQFTGRNH
jgi:hypothetical protein